MFPVVRAFSMARSYTCLLSFLLFLLSANSGRPADQKAAKHIKGNVIIRLVGVREKISESPNPPPTFQMTPTGGLISMNGYPIPHKYLRSFFQASKKESLCEILLTRENQTSLDGLMQGLLKLKEAVPSTKRVVIIVRLKGLDRKRQHKKLAR